MKNTFLWVLILGIVAVVIYVKVLGKKPTKKVEASDGVRNTDLTYSETVDS